MLDRAHRAATAPCQHQVNLTSFAVLALRAAGVAPSARTLAWIVRQQDSDGGFNFATAGGQSDVDDTGAALEALAGDAAAHAAIGARAVRFILRRTAERRRRIPVTAGCHLERAVDRVRDPGADRGRRAAQLVAPPWVASPLAYLSSLIAPDGQRPLFARLSTRRRCG